MPVSTREVGVAAISLPWSQVIVRNSSSGSLRDRSSHGLVDLLGDAAVGEVQQHHVAGGALDEGADRGRGVLADDQVAFPVAGHGPVFDLGWPFADHHHARGCGPRFSMRP